MQNASRIVIKNLVVAATLGLAALATWAVTDSQAPAIGSASISAPQG
jgi:hypothetical protein